MDESRQKKPRYKGGEGISNPLDLLREGRANAPYARGTIKGGEAHKP